jgi:hypothetical protein
MLELIDGLRTLRQEALAVSVILFDAPSTGGGQQRERSMARNLADAAGGSPKSVLMVLTGNHHSRITVGAPWDAGYEPMGYLLGREISTANLIALNVAHGGGSAWVSAPDCGIITPQGRHGDPRWAIEIDDATRPAPMTGTRAASRSARTRNRPRWTSPSTTADARTRA